VSRYMGLLVDATALHWRLIWRKMLELTYGPAMVGARNG
jgi:hypothetical protein